VAQELLTQVAAVAAAVMEIAVTLSVELAVQVLSF
jgi:hypothetical protein